MSEVLKRLWRAEEGQDLVEYSLLVVFLALAAVGGMIFLSNGVSNVFNSAGSNLSTQST